MDFKYLLLLRFCTINLGAVAMILAAWSQGLIEQVIAADVTGMVILICGVFIVGLFFSGWRIYKVSEQLNLAYNFDINNEHRCKM